MYCWRDGPYPKVQSQLLQTLMSRQFSFQLFQLKTILCYSTLSMRKLDVVSVPHSLCSIYSACKVIGQVYRDLSTIHQCITISSWWNTMSQYTLYGNEQHSSVGSNMSICTVPKSLQSGNLLGSQYCTYNMSWWPDNVEDLTSNMLHSVTTT